MPVTPTRHFGDVEFAEEAAIDFPSGLPGFEDHRRFLLIQAPEHAPLLFLQSLERFQTCLPALPVKLVDPLYELSAAPEDLELLGPGPPGELLCLCVISAPNNRQATANLLAPILIRPSTGKGVQAVRHDTRYSHAHRWNPEEPPCS